MRLPSLLLAAAVAPAWSAGPAPEIARGPARPQPPGVAHTVRTIPEACTRLEGRFTGDAASPYRLAAVRTSPRCQPRARWVEFDRAQPAAANGWKLNDEIRIPNAACGTQQAVVRVWRRPVDVAPPRLDAQGRARIYLQDAGEDARAGKLPEMALFAAQLERVDGACARER